MVAGAVAANVADIRIRNIVAKQTVPHLIFQPGQCLAETMYLFRFSFEQMQNEP
jgi:hypothetical protein